MSKNILVTIIALFCAASVSDGAELSVREKALVKVILRQQLQTCYYQWGRQSRVTAPDGSVVYLLKPEHAPRLTDFASLFLTDAPLHYESCHAHLRWLENDVDVDDPGDRQAVRTQLKAFLKRRTARPISPRGGATGVAPPEALLRQYAVRLLGKFGTPDDVSFLETLRELDEASLPAGLRYGKGSAGADNCRQAIRAIEARGNAKATPDG